MGDGKVHSEVCPPGKDYDGPCRETASTRIQHMLTAARRRVTALEQLQKIADKAENGSPLEEYLWDVLCRPMSPSGF